MTFYAPRSPARELLAARARARRDRSSLHRGPDHANTLMWEVIVAAEQVWSGDETTPLGRVLVRLLGG